MPYFSDYIFGDDFKTRQSAVIESIELLSEGNITRLIIILNEIIVVPFAFYGYSLEELPKKLLFYCP